MLTRWAHTYASPRTCSHLTCECNGRKLKFCSMWIHEEMCGRMTMHTLFVNVCQKTQLVKRAYNKGTICVMGGEGRGGASSLYNNTIIINPLWGIMAHNLYRNFYYYLYTNYLFWNTKCQTWVDRIQIPTTDPLGIQGWLMIIIPFCVTKSLAWAMNDTYIHNWEREREGVPTYLGTFHTNYIICRNVEIFKRYIFFLRDKNLWRKNKKENLLKFLFILWWFF